MYKYFLPFMIAVVVVILGAMIANVALSTMIPIFNQTAYSLPFINRTTYEQQSTTFTNMFWVALLIIIAIPFVWLIFRFLRREPEAQQQQQYYGGAF